MTSLLHQKYKQLETESETIFGFKIFPINKNIILTQTKILKKKNFFI